MKKNKLKKLQNVVKKLLKAQQRTKKLLNNISKQWQTYKTDMKKILFMMLCICCLMACGSTKVAVSRPQNGTYTQITVTTNNPITTDVQPNTNLDLYGNH